MRICNLGSLNIDRVYGVEHFVSAQETVLATKYERFLGGKGLNQSIALARSVEPFSTRGPLALMGCHFGSSWRKTVWIPAI